MFNRFRSFFLEENQGKVKLSQRAMIFLFCLSISSFFWLLTALSKDYNRRLFVSLEYSKLSSSFVLTQDPPEQIEVEVRGSGFELIGEQWSLDNNPISIDLNAAKSLSSSNRYYIQTLDLRTRLIKNLGANLGLRYIIPDTIYFRTERRYSKKVAVQADLTLNFESGYNLRAKPVLTPDSIIVSGPASFIDTVQKVLTEHKEVIALKDSLREKVDLELFEVKGVKMNYDQVDLLLAVEKFTEKKLDLDLQLVNTFDDRSLKTFPDAVAAYFLVPLSKYEYLDTTVVFATVKYTEENSSSKKLEVNVEGVPHFAKILRLEPDQVEYIIKE